MFVLPNFIGQRGPDSNTNYTGCNMRTVCLYNVFPTDGNKGRKEDRK